MLRLTHLIKQRVYFSAGPDAAGQHSPPNLSDLSLHLVHIFVERVDQVPLQVHEVLQVGRGGEDITAGAGTGEHHSHSPEDEFHRERHPEFPASRDAQK